MPRLVTLVFTDLVGSTAMKSALDGADLETRNRVFLEAILKPHRERVERRLEACGGRVVSTAGDGYFIAFEDLGPAIHWAVDVQRSHLGEPIGTPLGPLEVRIGMHVGSPVAEGTDFIGQEVDYAARIGGLAHGGQIALSEAAAVLARHAVDKHLVLHAHGEHLLKGIGRAPVYEILYDGRPPKGLREASGSMEGVPPRPALCLGQTVLRGELESALVDGGVVILKGEGGIGKTTLALDAVYRLWDEGRLTGGVAWIFCEPNPPLEECVRQLAAFLLKDRLDNVSLDECRRRVTEHWQRAGCLVVWDNYETVVGNHELIRWLAQVRPPARALLTTRELPAGLPGKVLPVRELARDDAVELFRRKAQRDLRGQDDLVGSMCDAVGNLPLAIELLAARSARVPLKRLADRLRKDLAVVDADSDPTRPERHQSARQCFALSYDILGEPAQRLLLTTCVFPAGVGYELMEEVMADDTLYWDDVAGELVAASVWRLVDDRWQVHPLVRQCALERLADRRAAELRGAGALASKARALQSQFLASPDEGQVFEWFAAEWPNLVAAAEMAFQHGEWRLVYDLATTIHEFCAARGFWNDAEAIYRVALQACEAGGDERGQGQMLRRLGLICRLQGRWSEAEQLYRDALSRLERSGDRAGQAYTLGLLGRVLQLLRRYDEAEAFIRKSLDLFRELRDLAGEARTTGYLGSVYRHRGQWAEAEAAYRQSLDLLRALHDRQGEAKILYYLGKVYLSQQRWAECEAAWFADLQICREFGNQDGQGTLLANLGRLYQLQGQAERAEATYQKSLQLKRQLEDPVGEGEILCHLAELRMAGGRREEGLALAQEARQVLLRTEDGALLQQVESLLGTHMLA